MLERYLERSVSALQRIAENVRSDHPLQSGDINAAAETIAQAIREAASEIAAALRKTP
jgi:hypothetical protein